MFNEQLTFRNKAIAEYQNNVKSLNGKNNEIDSVFNNLIRTKIGVRYLIPRTTSSFSVSLDNQSLDPAYLVGYDSLKIQYTIDEDKINSLINTQTFNIKSFEEILRYQDYIKISKSTTFHLKLVGVVITLAILVFLYFLFIFIDISDDKKESTYWQRSFITKLLGDIGKQKVKKDELEKVEDLTLRSEMEKSNSTTLEEIEKNVNKHIEANSEYYIIQNLSVKAEQKLKEVGSRSNLMLISGLIMSFVGVIIFYLTIPVSLGNSIDFIKILSLTIRPTFILLFVQAISWYLLKQHKSALTEYKYYHSIYNKKLNYLASYRLIQNEKEENSELKKLLPLMLLSEEIKNFAEEKDDDKIVETSKSLLESLIDKVMKKI